MTIATRYAETPWSAKDVAEATGLRPGHTTERLGRTERRLTRWIDAEIAAAGEINETNLARGIVAAVRMLGALALRDPTGTAEYLRRVIRSRKG